MRVGHFGDDFLDNLLLILAAVAVAGSVGIALAGESEGAGAINILVEPLLKHALPALQFQWLVGIDIDAAKCVDDLDDSLEADLASVVNLNAEQIFDGVFGHLDAVDAGVGELVFIAGGTVELDVIVARDRNEEDACGLWIYDGDDINIAAGGLGDGATRVGAGNIHCERLGGNVDGLAEVWCIGADFKLVNNARVVGKGRVGVFGEII